MRIGLIITELHPGGAEKCFVQLAIYLKSHGHEVQVWELWPAPPADKRQLTNLLEQHEIPWKSGGAVRPWQFFSATSWLKRELLNYKPDVVQSFLFHGNLSAAIASRGAKWKLIGGARVRQPERWRQILQRWSSKRMDRLVCVSQSVLEHCKVNERIPAEKLTVIANGISLAQHHAGITPSKFGIPSDKPMLLFVGRLHAQKGIDELLKHADAILEHLPNHQLVLLGDGPLKSELVSQRMQLKHGARVHFVGWQADPLSWMLSCEMLVLPARYEGMPNVVLEAMSVQKPVVVFDIDGIRELLGNAESAEHQIVAAGNFAEFREAIQKLAPNAEMREQCGRHNRDRIEKYFALDQQLAKYEELYERQHVPLIRNSSNAVSNTWDSRPRH